MKKSFLFFFVHPSKYYLFRHIINSFIDMGHNVDVVIITKDVLENLVKNEGWSYINIFPKGRRSKSNNKYSILFSTIINFFKTLWRLWFLTKGKKYDVFITDDCLSVIGWLKRVPCFFYIDDDISVVPESALLIKFAKHVLSPSVTNLGRYNYKIIPFFGYKELGSLHPKYFIQDKNFIKKLNLKTDKYYVLRLVSLTASHDIGKKGLDNNDVRQIINMLKVKGDVLITSERKLPDEFEQYRININPNEMPQVLYHAEFLISDSQTMSAEAGVLGTPYIRFNDFVGKISYLEELENKYNLGMGIKTSEKEKLFTSIEALLKNDDLKKQWNEKKEKMLKEKISVTDFLLWIFNEFPESVSEFKKNNDIQLKFIR